MRGIFFIKGVIIVEQWKPLKGIVENGENYEVSTLGEVRNVKTRKTLKVYSNSLGYLQIELWYKDKRKKYYLHRLVSLAFIPNHENKSDVNHRDGCKLHNEVTNLEWTTRKENIHHAVKAGLKKGLIGSNNIKVVLSEEQVKEIKTLHRNGYKQNQLAEMFSVCKQTISKIVNGKSWSHVE
jgi:hypothetical protein